LRLDTNEGLLSIATAGATYGHNAGTNTISVAASYWNSAKTGVKAFTGFANPIESFSSDGPRRIFYTPSGTPITPGNVLFGTNGGVVLQKPDITAADGGVVHTPSFDPFFGTSAASPHAAGVAALVWSANPNLTNTQVKAILLNTAVDNMSPGWDRGGGFGLVMAFKAVQAALVH
jgi:subtilisin family serine protease